MRRDLSAALKTGAVDDGLSQVVKDGTWLKLHRQFLPTAPVPAGFGS
ncbi:hypothetical protein [Amycolatopsis saalfeldensis]|uniref:Polar amino acid transport system substrate-binding protein n=1 Tax=Amycolatopsis saalfeldensis TaxID=394193 RepID=A0A1H8YLH1_9PSEU|nr:polar amino acid transport system substrate-binding protein [Amycolatopsis saalfeldensis]